MSMTEARAKVKADREANDNSKYTRKNLTYTDKPIRV